MHRIKAVIATCAVAALAVTALGAPAAAATQTTRMTIVNGDPFRKVDVCVNGREIRSGLPYGGKVTRTTKTSSAMVKFYKRSAKKCGGGLLAARRVYLQDAVVVLTRKTPKRVVLFNTLFPPPPAANGGVFYGHAGDMGEVEFVYDEHLITWTPAADGRWVKGFGDGLIWTLAPGEYWADSTAVQTLGGKIIAGPFSVLTKAGVLREYILVGTSYANAKLVMITRKH